MLKVQADIKVICIQFLTTLRNLKNVLRCPKTTPVISQMLHCCGCKKKVLARLTNGGEIYPHRTDLKKLYFWKCDVCKNYVGCRNRGNNRTDPLGCIPTPELRAARRSLHNLIDPVWKRNEVSRKSLYEKISKELGQEFHAAEIKTLDDAKRAYCAALKVLDELRIDYI
jgi:zinc-finger-containing domain